MQQQATGAHVISVFGDKNNLPKQTRDRSHRSGHSFSKKFWGQSFSKKIFHLRVAFVLSSVTSPKFFWGTKKLGVPRFFILG